MAAKPDFGHLDPNRWASFMTDKATRLEEVLWAERLQVWGACIVCDCEFPSNIKSHIFGKNHCRKLNEKLGWREPSSPAELQSYTQVWRLPSGRGYRFCHILGSQDYCTVPEHGVVAPASLPPPNGHPSACSGGGPAPMGAPAPMAPPAPISGGPPGAGCPVACSSGAAVGLPAGTVAGAAGYEHQPGYAQAINAKDTWLRHMTGPAQFLEQYLLKATGRWDFPCVFCCAGKMMTRGCENHLCSQGHWRALWNKMCELNPSAPMPPPEITKEWQRPWVQRFETPAGMYLFNHLTGGQMLAIGAPVPALPAAAPGASEPPAPAPPPLLPARAAAPASTGQPVFRDIRGLDTFERDGISWRDALNEKTKWQRYMAGPTEKLERFIYQHIPQHDRCFICQANMNGVVLHLTSQKHFKSMWNVGERVSSAEVAEWSAAWVERFSIPTTSGPRVYLYNHLTGAQGFEDELRGGAAQQPQPPPRSEPPAPGPPPTPGAASIGGLGDSRGLRVPPAAPHVAPAAPHVAPASAHVAPPGRPAGEEQAVNSYLIKMLAFSHGDVLQEALNWASRRSGQVEAPECVVCSTPIVNARDHLTSDGHLNSLRARIPSAAGPRYEVNPMHAQSDQPWVQDFGNGIKFNHITMQTFGADT